ncbi:MAG: RES domain-containing protein [Solirubrobacterales bacterium]|nr:RES domain-containing protein [Solirubrobacterales bacterium]
MSAPSGPGGLPGPVAVAGRFFRHQAARFERLGGSSFGGRWSPPNEFEAIYLARPLKAVAGEAYRHLVDRVAADPAFISARQLFTVEVALARVLDLRDEAGRRACGLLRGELSGAHDHCQVVGRRSFEAGYEGVLAPAATCLGETLCVFAGRVEPRGLRVVERRLWELPSDPRLG